MPLGDSITAGYLSTTGNGYRGPLSTLLASQAATLDLVGSQIGGTMLDPDHEGHSHYEIAQIAALTTQQVNLYKPNVVTLLAGVNDLGNSDDVANAPTRLAALIDQILVAEPDATVLVAKLIVSRDPTLESKIVTFNQQLAPLVQARSDAGKHVLLVDMGALSVDNLADNIHPNDSGYLLMAKAWATGIAQVAGKHWINDPVAGSISRPTGAIYSGVQNKCLDNAGSLGTPNHPADIQDCKNTVSEQWNLNSSAITTNGLCLDATGGGTTPGTKVILYSCTGAPNQIWAISANTLVNPASKLCLDDPGFSATNGTQMQLWDCNGGINQQWSVPFQGTIRSGLPGLCLDAFGGSSKPGTIADSYGCNNTAAQQWNVTNGTVSFDGQCLSLPPDPSTVGGRVSLAACTGKPNQAWLLQNGAFINPSTGSCLTVPGASPVQGTPLSAAACNGGSNQQWIPQTPTTSSTAETQDIAAASFAAWNSAFLVQNSGHTYYADEEVSVGSEQAKLYTGGLNIAVAEDAYEHSHSADQRVLIGSLLDTFLSDFGNGVDWTYDGYDDDLGWMTNAVLRGYQITGNPAYLTAAINNWNAAYNRGWRADLGGGIEEDAITKDGIFRREALSDDPFVFTGVSLYQITGDPTYLQKARTIYAWVRANLFNSTMSPSALGQPGQVNQARNDADNSLVASDNTYNGGSFITAAAALYRVTGDQQYFDDAALAIRHRMMNETILHGPSECCGNQWAYWFTKGLSQFATETGSWPLYLPYLQANASTAWAVRNGQNLTWNDWTTKTPDTVAVKDPDAVEMHSAVAIWQHLPPSSLALRGHYQLVSLGNGGSVAVANASPTKGAAVITSTVPGGSTSLWQFVPTSGGYFEIQNVGSSLLLNVAGASAKSGAPVVQWPAGRLIPGNDQWMPAENPDGTYTFYNLNSLQALQVQTNPTTAAGAQLVQSFSSGLAVQKFKLVPQP